MSYIYIFSTYRDVYTPSGLGNSPS